MTAQDVTFLFDDVVSEDDAFFWGSGAANNHKSAWDDDILSDYECSFQCNSSSATNDSGSGSSALFTSGLLSDDKDGCDDDGLLLPEAFAVDATPAEVQRPGVYCIGKTGRLQFVHAWH